MQTEDSNSVSVKVFNSHNQEGKMKISGMQRGTVWIAVILTSFFLNGAWAGAAYAEKMAFVDVAKTFDTYEKTKQNDQVLAEEGKKKQTQRDAMIQEIRRLKDELALLADKNKEEKQVAIDEKIKVLQDFDQKAREELSKKRDEAVREILKDIDTVMNDYGKQKGYDLIFNERALLYHNDKYDVTTDILNELNNRYKNQKGK